MRLPDCLVGDVSTARMGCHELGWLWALSPRAPIVVVARIARLGLYRGLPYTATMSTAATEQQQAWAFCREILPKVSRSFALIIPMCPAPIDRALCVAYLLCRVADTIEDETPKTQEKQQERLYDAFLDALDHPSASEPVAAFLSAWPRRPDGEYGRLLEGTESVLAVYAALDERCRGPIRTCVHDMIAGMRCVRAVNERAGITFYCADLPGLDQYCHYVAGTVGIMATALFETRWTPEVFTPTPQWREQGRRLGLGLQMTNIIKDCRVDAAERGVSYIPELFVDVEQGSYQLKTARRAALFAHAVAHLDAALEYICAVPSGETGIRAFLLGSHLPAIATLEAAVSGDEFHPKISREKMGEIFALVQNGGGDNDRVRAWYAEHRTRVITQV